MPVIPFTPPDFLAVLPELALLVMACVVLLAEAMGASRETGHTLSLVTLLMACVLIVFPATGATVHTFHGLFVDDAVSDLLKLMTSLGAIAAVIYSRDYLEDRGMLRGEYHALLLFAVLGMFVMISASHFLSLYLGLELLSLSLYAMVALQRESVAATEAAMKYFVLGALASGLLLYGMSLLYGLTGSLELGAIAEALKEGDRNSMVLAFGLVFIVAGLGFKLGAAPFHMWVPDVYHGAPTAVTLFIGSAPKLAAFAFTFRLLADGLEPARADWQDMLMVMAVVSLAVGNLAAIAQTNIKRMLAYSTISHMGFLLLGFIAGGQNGYAAAMYYAIAYVVMSLGAFGLILHLSRNGFEAENLDDYKGLNARQPWLAAVLAMFMLSMAGLPPFVGFYAKMAVLMPLVAAGWTWLAVLAVMFSLVGAFFYLRLVKLMYFDAPHADASAVPPLVGSGPGLLLSLNGLAMLILGLLPQPLIAMCANAVRLSFL